MKVNLQFKSTVTIKRWRVSRFPHLAHRGLMEVDDRTGQVCWIRPAAVSGHDLVSDPSPFDQWPCKLKADSVSAFCCMMSCAASIVACRAGSSTFLIRHLKRAGVLCAQSCIIKTRTHTHTHTHTHTDSVHRLKCYR